MNTTQSKKQIRDDQLKSMFEDEEIRYKAYIHDQILRFLFRVIGLVNTTVAGILTLLGVNI